MGDNDLDFANHIWACDCGSTDMWLRRDGRITCQGCEKDTGQIWIWDKAND